MSQFTISAFADEINADLDIQMKVLKECGVDYIEMRGVDGKNISQYTPNEIIAIKNRLDAQGIKISALGSPIGKIKLTDDFNAEIERLKNLLELANILETKYIRIFSFFDAQNERGEVMDRLGQYIDIAKGTRMALLHENEKDIYGDIATRCLDICETFGMRAIFDPANFVQCGENVLDAYNMLKPHIEYMHIKDAVAVDGHVVPAGFGDGYVKEILSDLKNTGYEGYLSLEPHLSDFTGFTELEGSGISIKETVDDNEKTFKIAADALNKILESI